MAKGSIKARIQCTIDVPVGTWSGGEVDTDRLMKQVKQEGRNLVEKLVQHNGGQVVSEPKVIFIVMNEE